MIDDRYDEFNGPAVELAVDLLLKATGEDTTREGVKRTPERYRRFLEGWLNPPPFEFTTFDGEGMDEMVVQTGIPFWSLCEHHLLPFVGTAAVGYVPGARIVGLSKLARAVQHCARGFQNQERITQAVANLLEERLQPQGVAVILRAEHMCMTVRGVKAPGAVTTTSCLTGVFRDPLPRTEFLDLAGQDRSPR